MKEKNGRVFSMPTEDYPGMRLFAALSLDMTPEGIRQAVGAGADVDMRDGEGKTLLMAAALLGLLEHAQALLELGAQVNAADDGGWQPVHFAAQWNRSDIVRLLAEAGADLNARTPIGGETPLSLAAQRNGLETVNALLGLGADPNVPDAIGRSPMVLARGSRVVEMVAALRHAPVRRERPAHEREM